MKIITIVFLVIFIFVDIKCAYIEENAYKAVSISFSEKVQQQTIDFKSLKVVLRKASDYLYHATRKRSYFEEFVLAVPSSWISRDMCDTYITEAPHGIDLYLSASPDVNTLTAKHSRGCGEKGDVIYMPPSWLRGNTEVLARQFLQQWSIFRYGVFEEIPETDGSCYMQRENSWSPTGCYNVKLDMELEMDENGLPICFLPVDFYENEELRSSLMFTDNSTKVLDFCDGSKSLPHNPVMPTLHNRLCQGRTVWSVLTSSDDFKYGRNLPREEENPPADPVFRCFREPPIQLTLAVQNSSTGSIANIIMEIRYTLLNFLTTMPPTDSRVNLVTFSDANYTESGTATDLSLQKKEQLAATLDQYVRTFTSVSNVCLSCGLQKALNVSTEKGHPFPTVLLIAWESALIGEKTSHLIQKIRNYDTLVLYLVLIEDTQIDIPSALVDAIRKTRGQIFKIAEEAVFMSNQLNVVLVNAFKSLLHIEDKIIVVHEAVYKDVTSDIIDTFVTQPGADGKLLYIMHCSDKDMIESINSNCSTDWGAAATYKCGEDARLNDDKILTKTWKYPFKYKPGPSKLICSSLAMIKLESAAASSFTLRGWFNHNQITPGRNVLIIYAEVSKSLNQVFHVEAKVTGPGLASPFAIELRDNGNGDPDTKKGDGIYSRYFTSFSEKGTYVVTISAKVIEDVTYTNLMEGNDETGGKLTQTKVIGSFSVTESPPKIDIFPPNRVTDLRVTSVDHQNRTIALRWTAPGNDYDYGKAAGYKVYFSEDWKELQDSMLDKIPANTLNTPESFSPNEAGQDEMYQFQLPNRSIPKSYYISLSGIDNCSNKGSISNIVQVYIIEDSFITLNKTSVNETGNVTETSTDNNLKSCNMINNSLIWYTAISGSIGIFILLILFINIMIWVYCFKKYKQMLNKDKRDYTCETATKMSEIGNQTNSEQIILKNEYQDRHANLNQVMDSYTITSQTDTDGRNLIKSESQLYAKVHKMKENSKAPLITEDLPNERTIVQHKMLKPKENDLGFV